jgi:hypothetical protein
MGRAGARGGRQGNRLPAYVPMCLSLSYLQSKRFFEHAVEEARATARNVLSRAIGLALVTGSLQHWLAAEVGCERSPGWVASRFFESKRALSSRSRVEVEGRLLG